ncbi:hypothetical protein OG311_13465 [Streptomyces sp. NBC_01343]|uniref:hypothetical protein n=1 Tax=Streptomyces sp. NBC_01343 TaxID=2903832 RepID=UPI002E1054A0|nr:hypothetical protein OG311_13465 [Streptomyces sp. NBC_01343]
MSNLYGCLVCSRPSEWSKTCEWCQSRIRGALAQLPEQYVYLTMSRQRVRGGGGDGRSPKALHSPVPGRDDVLNLLGPASRQAVIDAEDQVGDTPFLEVLGSWSEAVTDERRLTPVSRNVTALTTRLTGNLTWIYEQPWVADFFGEIEELLRAAQRITMTRPRKELLRGITCPSCEGLTLVRYVPGAWAAECVMCWVKLNDEEYGRLVKTQARALQDSPKS